MKRSMKRLVVIPSDPIADYEKAGYDGLEGYYNPAGCFEEVFVLSPLEVGERKAYGMTICGVKENEFARRLRDLRPQVIRSYGGYWPADLVARHRGGDAPWIASVHDPSDALIHPSLRFADLVICMSEKVRRQVLKRGVDPARIRILPNRVDMDRFRPIVGAKSPVGLPSGLPSGKHILHIGRRSEQKNLDTLIRAMAQLPAEFSCVFVGRGDRDKYESLAREWNVSERCFWVDSVQNSELPAWYAWCDCMCTPSRWEGFGIVFIEAAACGAPIITSDLAPMNEYLEADRSACLVREYENPDRLARAIRKVCWDDDYRRKISKGAIEAAKPFERRNVDAREVAIYEESMKIAPLSFWRRVDWMLWRFFGQTA